MPLSIPSWVRKSVLHPLALQIATPKDKTDDSPAFSVAEALQDPKRILLIPDNQPGGIFIGASKFWAIRERYPNASLDLLAHSKKEFIAREIPFIDETILYENFVFPFGLRRREVIDRLAGRDYDLAFCFSNIDDFCPAYYCYKSGARVRIGFQSGEVAFFNIRIVPKTEATYEPDRLSLLLDILGIPESKEGVSWSVSEEGGRRIRDRYLVGNRSGERLVGLDVSTALGETPTTKQFLSIAKSVTQTANTRVLIFFNYEERKEANHIKEALGPKALMFQNEDLPRLVVLLEACDRIVAGNTDIFHLAVSMGRPVTGVFSGEQVPKWAPAESEDVRILDLERLKTLPAAEIARFLEAGEPNIVKSEELAV
jgi:ADP-heptose:LPS heptosyltransferase